MVGKELEPIKHTMCRMQLHPYTAAPHSPTGLQVAGVRVSPTLGGEGSGVTVEGPLAAALRRAAYLYRQPTDEQRLRVAASWVELAAKTGASVLQQVLTGGPVRGGSGGGSK